jgi:protein-disulfide isomerase
MDRINRLMVEKLIGAEAKKANLPLDEFIDKKIVKGETKISDSEFKKFVADKKIPESQLNPQIRDRINQYLQGQKKQELIQAYVAKITKSQPVEVYFARPALDVKVEVGSAPVTTTKDTKVTIIEFSDFQCPFCARGAEVVQELKKAYGSKVKIAFRHFPLPMHKEARPASEASMCVNEQSTDKFWKFHDILFKNQQSLDNESLAKYAKEAGADVAKFKACFESKKYAKQVQEDMEYGEKIGVRSTPTFFVNGQIVNGAVPKEQFDELISEAMASK